MADNHINNFFSGAELISKLIDKRKVKKLAEEIYKIKKKRGRLFFLGVGGSALIVLMRLMILENL